MQIEKAQIHDHLGDSKASWKFHIPTIYNFVVIYPWNLLFSQQRSLLFSSFNFVFIIKALRLNNSKTGMSMNAKISVFVVCVESIIYLLLYNLHDCIFKWNTLIMISEERLFRNLLISLAKIWIFLWWMDNILSLSSHFSNAELWSEYTILHWLFMKTNNVVIHGSWMQHSN